MYRQRKLYFFFQKSTMVLYVILHNCFKNSKIRNNIEGISYKTHNSRRYKSWFLSIYYYL